TKLDPDISIQTVHDAGSDTGPKTDASRDFSNGYDLHTEDKNGEPVSGILDVMSEGHGFLRPKFRPSDRDIYISSSQIRRFWLRAGDLVEGLGRPPKDNERYF